MADEQLNGLLGRLGIRGWQDLVGFLTVAAMYTAVIVWGLSMEAKIDRHAVANRSEFVLVRAELMALRVRVDRAEAALDGGVLPITQERLQRLRRDLDRLEDFHR